jgi:uncharacterized protein (DUF2342 family)
MIRDLASQAIEPVERGDRHVRWTTRMRHRVVDRAAWIQSNAHEPCRWPCSRSWSASMSVEPPDLLRELGSRGSAIQVGVALAWLSGKVLGQHRGLRSPGERGRLLLVAPTDRSGRTAAWGT